MEHQGDGRWRGRSERFDESPIGIVLIVIFHRGLVTEQPIPVASLKEGEQCWISNGVRGFIAATVRLSK